MLFIYHWATASRRTRRTITHTFTGNSKPVPGNAGRVEASGAGAAGGEADKTGRTVSGFTRHTGTFKKASHRDSAVSSDDKTRA